MEDKINNLYIWLQQNGFQKEASLVKSALITDDNLNFREDQRASLDPANPEEAFEAIHIVLDVAGLFPTVGEPADLVNSILYLIREKYFEAALSLLALIPGLGIAATLAKRAMRPAEVAVELAKAVKKTNIDPDTLSNLADNQLDLLKRALGKMKAEMPEEYAKHIPPDAHDQVQSQIEWIISNIKSSRYSTSIPRSPRPDASMIPIQDRWESLTPEFISTLRATSVVAAERTLVRSADHLGPFIKERVKRLIPNLENDMIETIATNCAAKINNIQITLFDDIAQVYTEFGADSINTPAWFTPTSKTNSASIEINLPSIVWHAESSSNIPNQISTIIQHEVTHNLDHIIGESLDDVIGTGWHKSAPDGRRRYSGEPNRLDTGPRTARTDVAPDDKAPFVSTIKGTPVGDSIERSIKSGAIRGDGLRAEVAEYLLDPAELMARFRNLKLAVLDSGALNLFNAIKNHPDGLQYLVGTDGRPVYDLLRNAHNTSSPEAYIKAITLFYNNNMVLFGQIRGVPEYGRDIFDIARIIDYEKLRSSPELIMDIYNAV